MKPTSRLLYLKIVAMALAFAFGVSAFAETPREELVHAYILLKMANHDYDGHRVKAMEAVAAAGRELGLKLEGKGSDREGQLRSDEQLAEARRLLREAREKLELSDRNRVAGHVEKALKEINTALKIK